MKNTLLLSVILCFTLTATCQDYTSGGSLVVAMQTTEGMLIVADKKLTSTTTTTSFTNAQPIYSLGNKISKFNTYYAYAITGRAITSFNPLLGGVVTFDMQQIVSRFLDQYNYPYVTASFLDSLGQFIKNEYKETLLLHDRFSPPNGTRNSNLTTDVLICGYNPTLKKFQIGIVKFNMGDVLAEQAGLTYILLMEEGFLFSSILFTGHVDLILELQSGSNIKYDELRKNKLVDDVIHNKKRKLYKPEYAIKLAKWIIEETSKITPTVSKEVDVAIIDEKGFRWLEHN